MFYLRGWEGKRTCYQHLKKNQTCPPHMYIFIGSCSILYACFVPVKYKGANFLYQILFLALCGVEHHGVYICFKRVGGRRFRCCVGNSKHAVFIYFLQCSKSFFSLPGCPLPSRGSQVRVGNDERLQHCSQ